MYIKITRYDEQIEELQKQMLKLIEDNTRQGAVSEDFDGAYKIFLVGICYKWNNFQIFGRFFL